MESSTPTTTVTSTNVDLIGTRKTPSNEEWKAKAIVTILEFSSTITFFIKAFISENTSYPAYFKFFY